MPYEVLTDLRIRKGMPAELKTLEVMPQETPRQEGMYPFLEPLNMLLIASLPLGGSVQIKSKLERGVLNLKQADGQEYH
jgi:hypothetical protein